MERSGFVLLASCAVALLTGCSTSAPPPPSAPAASAAKAPATSDAAATKELALYDQMRASQSWDLAASLGDEIVQKYPASAAAATAKQTLADVHAKGDAQRESRRLAKLWSYASVPEAGGTQYTAAVESREPLHGSGAKANERVRLVLRVHPKWGRSVYLLLDNAKFDCRKGCATLPVKFDDAAPQRMKATVPPTGEPALFIDDDKAFIA